MTARRLAFLPLLLLLLPGLGWAAEPDCTKADTQAVLDLCAAKELNAADKELSRVRKVLTRQLKDAAAKTALTEAENAWDLYRDAECKFEASGVAGGSAEHMVLAYCQAQRTRTRVRVLQRILDCKEGDLTCPALTR